jgi:hypothetical protein
MWNIYLYFIILKLFTNFQNIIFLVKIVANASLINIIDKKKGGRRGRDRMVVGFITTYAISACHH